LTFSLSEGDAEQVQEDCLVDFVGEACEPLTFTGAIATLPTQLREGICRSNAAAAVEAAVVQPEQCEGQEESFGTEGVLRDRRTRLAGIFANRTAELFQPLKEQPSMATRSKPCFAPCGANSLRSRLEELDKFHQALTTGSSSSSAAAAVLSVTNLQREK